MKDVLFLAISKMARWLKKNGFGTALVVFLGCLLADRIICGAISRSDVWAKGFFYFWIHAACVIVGVGSGILSVVSAIYARKTGGGNAIKEFLDGKSLSELWKAIISKDPRRLDVSEFPAGDWRGTDGVILGKVDGRVINRPSNDEGNLAVFAGPGSGKTTAQIIPTAMRFGGSVLAIDIKGDILSNTREERNIKVFCPDTPEQSCHFNPLSGLEMLTDTERCAYLEELSRIILPDVNEETGRFFAEGGRDFFCGIAVYMHELDPSVTLPLIAAAIVTRNALAWVREIIERGSDRAKSYVASFFGANEKNVIGAYQSIVKAVRNYSNGNYKTLLDSNGDTISADSLEEGFDVYLQIPQDKIQQYAPLCAIMIQHFLQAFMRRPDSGSGAQLRPILFLLDEFPQLPLNHGLLTAALSTLRSKNVSIFIAAQSIAQLQNRYGTFGTREIIDNCSIISIMGAQDPESRKYFTAIFGDRLVASLHGAREVREPVFWPDEFADLGDDVAIFYRGKYVRAKKTYCFKNE